MSYPSSSNNIPTIILPEGTSQTKGRDAQNNNLTAALLLADLISSSLGPRGLDKMLVDTTGDAKITNDGATMLKEMDIQHPAAKMLVEISKSLDSEVGDGTTSAVIFAGALLTGAKELLQKGIHPSLMVEGYSKAAKKALQILEEISIRVEPQDVNWLRKVAKTSMQTKIVSRDADYLAGLVVDAVLSVADKTDSGYKVDKKNIKVLKGAGGVAGESSLIKGVVVDKEVAHASMPKRIENARILVTNTAFEVEKPEMDTKLNITSPEQMKQFIDSEDKMLYDIVQNARKSGANVMICLRAIDDLALQYLASAGILAVKMANMSDLERIVQAAGGSIIGNLGDVTPGDLGRAKLVEERKVEDKKWVFIEGCKDPKAVTILIRGGFEKKVDEMERAIDDAIMVTRDVMERPLVVAGGGAPEIEVALKLRAWLPKLSGRVQLAAQKFAEAMEKVSLTLAANAGMSPIDASVALRSRHSKGGKWIGVDASDGTLKDMYKSQVFEPTWVKEQIIKSATEASNMILRIDEVLSSTSPKKPPLATPTNEE